MEFRQFMAEDTAHRFRQSYRRMGITCRLGRPGSVQDNAVIDSWLSTLEFKLSSLAWTRGRGRIDDSTRDRRHPALGMNSLDHL